MPFGNEGWKEKKRIFHQLIASRPAPPLVYNDVLILVPSSRMKRLYGRFFLDAVETVHRSSALVPPEVQTLHQLLQTFFSSGHGQPRLIDENARLILLEGLVKERLASHHGFNQKPELLSPSLSSVLAKTIEELSAAEVGPGELISEIKEADFFDKPQVALLIDVYTRYRDALKDANLTDPAGMRAALRDRFDPQWIGRYRLIIVDGVQTGNRLEADIVKKITDCADCTFLVDAPSPDLLFKASDSHPLRIVRDFLSGIGITANDPAGTAAAEDGFLAGALFSEKTFSDVAETAPDPGAFAKTINLLSALNTREEVSLIASEVKKSLQAGTDPDSILVAFPALDQYGALVEEIFHDYGIPYNRALGRQLSASPVATALVSLLGACQQDYPAPSLLRILSSPFLKFGRDRVLAPSLDRLMRSRKIAGGRQKLTQALASEMPDENGKCRLTDALKDLFSALEPFSRPDPAPLSLWMERLSDIMRWSELSNRVAAIKGPLNANEQAYKKLNEVLASLSRAGRTFPAYRYSLSEWLFLLKKTFMHARFQVPPEDEGGVQILGLEESLGHPWNEIYLGGLVDGKFPQRMPQNIFLPEQTLESMGVRTLERARLNASYHFYRLLLSARKVTLTFPENEGDKPVVPSPFIQELTPLKRAGLLNRGMIKTSGLQFSLNINDSRSMPELAKAVSRVCETEPESVPEVLQGLSLLTRGMPGLSPAVDTIRSGLDEKSPARAPEIPHLSKRRFSVTELDAYLNCPYDYYITAVLGLRPVEETSEDLTPQDRGSKAHGILKRFYEEWRGPVTPANRDKARVLLDSLVEKAFQDEVATFRNRREKELFLWVMSGRFLDAEIDFWTQGMQPVFLEKKIEGYPLLLSTGEKIELTGKIDRIDSDESGNFVIVDYKTGRYPLSKMGDEQDIFQLPVYAVMARQALKDAAESGDRTLRNPIGLAYYDLAGKTGPRARDVVLFNKDEKNDHPSSKPKASAKSASQFKSILKQSMDKARTAVEAILAGDFTPRPRDENKCRFCPNEILCAEESDED
jgi:ATP-dependent helicase/DNAse subunit B